MKNGSKNILKSALNVSRVYRNTLVAIKSNAYVVANSVLFAAMYGIKLINLILRHAHFWNITSIYRTKTAPAINFSS
jgi:hypothetical protein